MNYYGNDNKIKNYNLFAMMTGFMIGISVLAYSFAQEPTIITTVGDTYAIGTTTTVQTGEEGTGSTESGNKQAVKLITSTHQGQDSENGHVEETYKSGDKLILTRGNEEAQKIAQYMWSIHPDKVMIATFIAESGLNPRSKSNTNDFGLCQLNYQYNKKVIDDPRFSDWMRQASKCVEKRQNSNPNIWYAYKNGPYKKFLKYFNH